MQRSQTRQEQRTALQKNRRKWAEKLKDVSQQDEEAKERLIQIQTEIAGHTSAIEEMKQEIMNILGSRASKKAIDTAFTTRQRT